MKNLLPCLLVLLPAVLGAKDFYVRPGYTGGAHTGADWNNAWNGFAEIQWGAGVASLGPGDTCWIAGGTYGAPLVIGASGTAGSPITLKRVRATDPIPTAAAGWELDFDAQVIIVAADSCVYFYNGLGSYVTVDGQVDSGIRVNYANGGRGVELDGGLDFTNVMLRYIEASGPGPVVETDDTRGFDLTTQGALTNITLSHCKAHHSDTLIQATPSANLVIEYCDLHHSGAVNYDSFHPNTIYLGAATNVTIRYNQLHDFDVEGIFFGEPGNNGARIYGNLFYQGTSAPDTGRGIEFDDTADSTDVLVYNNTFVDLPLPGVSFGNGGLHPGAVVQDNLFYNTEADFGPATHDYNWFSGAGASEAHGIAHGAAPFVNATAFNYHILSAVGPDLPKDKGVNLGAPFNLDLDGVIRGSGGGWDIGAYESVPLPDDFNGDGKADILLTNIVTGERAIWLMNGTAISAGASLGLLSTDWSFDGIGDCNADGKADIVLTNHVTGERAIWLMEGTKISAGVSLGLLPLSWVISGESDFNGDGKSDVLLTNNVTGERAIWLMNGPAIGSGASLGVLSTNWSISGTGDFNGDGKSDIILTNTVTGERAIWLMNGPAIGSGASLGVISRDWAISGTGDFDGDGKADIILTNTVTGDRAIWLMDGFNIVGARLLGMVPVSYVISGTGDLDGNGKCDVFLTNTITGDRAFWLMDGAAITSANVVGLPARAQVVERRLANVVGLGSTDWLIAR